MNKCPKCSNFSIEDLGETKKTSATGFAGFLIKGSTAASRTKHTYKCKKCGHTWEA